MSAIKLTQPQLDTANAQLAPYGYSIGNDRRFVRPDGKSIDVTLECKVVKTRQGAQCQYTTRQANTRAKLWSGTDVARFVTGFWFAKPLTASEVAS